MLEFIAQDIITVINEAQKNKCDIFVAKDHGVYLMSEKCDFSKELGRRKNLAFAKGCNPYVDEDWYDLAESEAGGDDFFELISANDPIMEKICERECSLFISFAEDGFSLMLLQ